MPIPSDAREDCLEQIAKLETHLENLKEDITKRSARCRSEAESFVTHAGRLAMLVSAWVTEEGVGMRFTDAEVPEDFRVPDDRFQYDPDAEDPEAFIAPENDVGPPE